MVQFLFYILFVLCVCFFQVLIFTHHGHRLNSPSLECVWEGLQNQILGLDCGILAAKNGGRKPGRTRKFSQIIMNDTETGTSIISTSWETGLGRLKGLAKVTQPVSDGIKAWDLRSDCPNPSHALRDPNALPLCPHFTVKILPVTQAWEMLRYQDAM